MQGIGSKGRNEKVRRMSSNIYVYNDSNIYCCNDSSMIFEVIVLLLATIYTVIGVVYNIWEIWKL